MALDLCSNTASPAPDTSSDIAQVIMEDERWQTCDLPALANRAFAPVFKGHSLNPNLWSIGVLGCDDTRITALNATFRDKPTPTNVLSWPTFALTPAQAGQIPANSGFEDSLGDIALAYETVLGEIQNNNNAKTHTNNSTIKMSFNDYVCYLLIHGCLHLLGYDHETSEDAAAMHHREKEYLAVLQINHPFGDMIS